MISVTWLVDVDSNIEYLECRNEELGNEPRENRVDVVKVYFINREFDAVMVKTKKLEMAIARSIFSNRSKYGSSVDATLDVYPNTIHFRTGTDAEIYNEYWPINLEGAEK